MNQTYKFAMILFVLATMVVMAGCASKSGNGNVNMNAPTTPTPSTLTPAQVSAGNNTSSSIQNPVHGQPVNRNNTGLSSNIQNPVHGQPVNRNNTGSNSNIQNPVHGQSLNNVVKKSSKSNINH